MARGKDRNSLRIVVAGAGIGGLAAALSLYAAGLRDIRIVEACPRLRPVGAGLNLQPAAVRELTELGVAERLAGRAVATGRLEYHHRYGGVIWSEPRGLAAGYRWPQYSVHRGRLQTVLLDEVRRRLGAEALTTGWRTIGYQQRDGAGDRTVLVYGEGGAAPLECDLLVGADGVNSAVRGRMYPGEGPPLANGIRMWRGIGHGPPFLDGRTMLILGCNSRVKAVVYPLTPADRTGRCLLNWVVEARDGAAAGPPAHWDAAVPAAGALRHLTGWRNPHLDLHALISSTARVLRYPMIDRDPVPTWVDGRVVLLGDAAHPMYPTGSNGASQAIVDARFLAHHLARRPVDQALAHYDRVRRPETSRLLAAHRRMDPDALLHEVENLAPYGFTDIGEVLAPDKLAGISTCTRRVTGVDAAGLNARPSWDVPERTAPVCAWPTPSV
ncbi:FAD-dependent monooxygenase [Streptomyces sp. LP05-1]|uniref:FAD-dependent monooxygenase n=1 Tax=Streptomyces pyxinae TaxID=2970734 RepID=A0ABT2CC22_9ACTN|nr:FAD-dependent monooxygenase [Streptomyces sp. LP05-1]MCS0634928.1 FAD-dependent monooxygenase [Streptomyces sp. LP05-1]